MSEYGIPGDVSSNGVFSIGLVVTTEKWRYFGKQPHEDDEVLMMWHSGKLFHEGGPPECRSCYHQLSDGTYVASGKTESSVSPIDFLGLAELKLLSKVFFKSAARSSATGFSSMGAARSGFAIADAAEALIKQVGKNSISIRTPNQIIHYDLVGAIHKGVATPHVQYSIRNVNRFEKVFFNKNWSFVRPMTR